MDTGCFIVKNSIWVMKTRKVRLMAVKDKKDDAAIFRLRDFLPFRLAVMGDQVSRVFSKMYQNLYDLSLTEWRLLAVIAEHGSLSPTAAGQASAMDKVKVTRASQGLAAKGLVRRSRDPRDGRGLLLRLTRKGAVVHAKVVPHAAHLEARLFDDLSRADRASLERLLSKVMTSLETAEAGG